MTTPIRRQKRSKSLENARIARLSGGMLLVIPPESPPRPRSGTASGGLPEACPQAEVCGGLELFCLAYTGVWYVVVFTVVVAPYPASNRHIEFRTTPSVAEGQIAKLRTRKSFGGNKAPMPPNPCSPSSPGIVLPCLEFSQSNITTAYRIRKTGGSWHQGGLSTMPATTRHWPRTRAATSQGGKE